MKLVLTKLFDAADNHAEDSGDSDHAVGDLQDLLREAWSLMSPSQRLCLIDSDAVYSMIETGARGEFIAEDLTDLLNREVQTMEETVVAAGYRIMETVDGFYWETDDTEGLIFVEREDAVADAFSDLKSVNV